MKWGFVAVILRQNEINDILIFQMVIYVVFFICLLHFIDPYLENCKRYDFGPREVLSSREITDGVVFCTLGLGRAI